MNGVGGEEQAADVDTGHTVEEAARQTHYQRRDDAVKSHVSRVVDWSLKAGYGESQTEGEDRQWSVRAMRRLVFQIDAPKVVRYQLAQRRRLQYVTIFQYRSSIESLICQILWSGI